MPRPDRLRFPVLLFDHDRTTYGPIPADVPWAVVEKVRRRVEQEYGTTLEAIAAGEAVGRIRRSGLGGLDPIELWCACRNRGYEIVGSYRECYGTAVAWLKSIAANGSTVAGAGR